MLWISFQTTSCTETIEPTEIGFRYYPIKPGTEWIYRIDSSFFEPFAGDSTRTIFERRSTCTGTRMDAAHRVVFEVTQFRRPNSSLSWQYESTYYVYKDEFIVEENRSNVRLVPLIFPIKKNKVWDGNQLNNKGKQPFVYRIVGDRFVDSLHDYEETLMVERMEDSTFFDQQRDLEYYGKNVGLFRKEHINFTTVNNNKSGTRICWDLLEYTF